MDPVTVGAVLLALVTGASEALGGQLWAGVVSLVRRPVHDSGKPGGELPAAGSGKAELAALQESPGDHRKAVALAEVLLARASSDPAFERALRTWWAETEPIREKSGSVTNTISGGTFNAPVLRGRDFTGLTFGATPPPPRPQDPDADRATPRLPD